MGEECEMKGWFYLLRFNRFGLQYLRKRYFILEDSCLRSFKSIPSSGTEEPLRSAIIDSCIRVIDNRRESHHMKLFFMFTLINTSNHNDILKLGANSSEDAARWIRALQDAAVNSVNSLTSCSERKWQPFSLSVLKRMSNKRCVDDRPSVSSEHVNAMTSDVIASSPWKIFGCQNGLRLFKESKDRDSEGKGWGNQPAIMAVGIIDGASDDVFHTLMSLGTSRTEWDFCFYWGSVIEHLDGHTDIIYIQLYNHWLPWAMKRRDLLLRRYWRREEDGIYVIIYHSVVHRKCPPRDGYVRAYLKSGGYVISPTKQGKECVIKYMLALDWRFWKSYIRKASSRSIAIRMLGRVACIALVRAKSGNSSHECVSRELTIDMVIPASYNELIMTEVGMKSIPYKDEDELVRQISGASSLGEMDDAADEFFDVPEPMDDEQLETDWCSIKSTELCYVDKYQPKLSFSANFVNRLHDLAVQKKGYLELREISREESVSSCYGTTLPKDSTVNMPCSWAEADASSFLIRGDNYLQDHQKRYAAQGWPEFFFIINIQVPGTTTYSLALYYMLKTPLGETPLLQHFVNGDDTFRNSRFKLIPCISKGSWIVKQSVGKKACLIGQALEINYFRGKNYLELGVDIGSSTVAKGVVGLVLGYLNNLVIEMAFLLQGNTEDELPEVLLGACRLNHLDVSKSVPTDSIISSS